VGIGMIMAVLFHRDDMARSAQIESFQDNAGVSRMSLASSCIFQRWSKYP
jgi:hypothetical protein